MSLKEQIAADVETVFLNTDDFAESVTLIAKNGDEREVTVVVEDEETPLEDNRAQRRRTEKCIVWAKQATACADQPVSFDHADGPVAVEMGLAMLRDGDRKRKWDYTGDTVRRGGGMIGVKFQRVNIESAGDLTPGIGR